MRDFYRRFGVTEGIFCRLSFIVRILLPNPPLSSDSSYVEFYTVVYPRIVYTDLDTSFCKIPLTSTPRVPYSCMTGAPCRL
jgi:hypothetical protein